VLLLAVGAAMASAVPAEAILSGRGTGRIAFTSGRTAGDATAQIFIRNVNFNSGGSGTLGPPFGIVSNQARHPSWSPDRTRIVFAVGLPDSVGTPLDNEEYDLFVRDLEEETLTVLDAAELDAESSDHPAWSPDGTKIAYEHQPADGSTDRDIMVKTVGTATPAVALTTGAAFDLKPAWSPDSQEIYYATSPTPPPGATQFDIVKKDATASAATAPTPVANVNTVDEYQPSLSPDGTKICYTRQSTLGDTSTAEIFTAGLPGLTTPTNITNNAGQGDINCTWSPNGLRIAHSKGTFSSAELVIRNADGSNLIQPFENDPGGNDFDGNPDWAPDGSPDCPDSTVTTQRNTAVTFQVTCTDTGPAYERTDVRETFDTTPASGTLTQDLVGEPFTYTPAANFTGSVSFLVRGIDDFSFGTDTGTITINVRAPGAGPGGVVTTQSARCGGRTATIVGTAGNNRLVGTTRRDVIAGLGGNDTIRGGRGNDIICGGTGRDRIGGGSGNDRAAGGSGNDRVSGDSGRDSLKGDSGNDRLNGGSGRDNLNGGSGRDRLNGGSSRDGCKGRTGRDRGASCERSSSIP
jgi:Tol biopolymer transport system component